MNNATLDNYWRFAESERHFNEIQSGIRNHAATWILAAFAGIAILLKTEEKTNWLLAPPALVGAVCAIATLGLLMLWINDQLVYQRLLGAVFIIALKMEYDNPQLPPIRAMMMYSADGKGMPRWMAKFYTLPMGTFLTISLLATLWQISIGATVHSLVVLVFACLAQLSAMIWVLRHKTKVEARSRAGLFKDAEFEKMFEGTAEARERFGAMIARHKPPVEPDNPTIE